MCNLGMCLCLQYVLKQLFGPIIRLHVLLALHTSSLKCRSTGLGLDLRPYPPLRQHTSQDRWTAENQRTPTDFSRKALEGGHASNDVANEENNDMKILQAVTCNQQPVMRATSSKPRFIGITRILSLRWQNKLP
jgi:hypothetical protein